MKSKTEENSTKNNSENTRRISEEIIDREAELFQAIDDDDIILFNDIIAQHYRIDQTDKLDLATLNSIRDKQGYTLINYAAFEGCFDIIKQLIKFGVDLEAATNGQSAYTPLLIAVTRKHTMIVKSLIENGANIEARSKDFVESTSLIHAAMMGYTELVSILLGYGADIEACTQNSSNETSLTLAIINGHTGVVKVLLEYGADISAIDSQDEIFTDFTIRRKRGEIIKLLEYAKLTDNIFERNNLTKDNISQILSNSTEPNSLIDINDDIKEMLSRRITAKFWINIRNNIKLESVQEVTANDNHGSSHAEDIHYDTKKTQSDLQVLQQVMVKSASDLKANINNNIALIQEYHNNNLSFLKNCFNYLSHSEHNSDSIMHDNDIVTLFNLALLLLNKSEQIHRIEEAAGKYTLADKTLNLHRVFQNLTISKLFSLSDNIVAKFQVMANSG